MSQVERDHGTWTEKRGAKWQAICEDCGEVGVEQEFDGDAEAIAERHHEIGGFER